MKPQIASSIEQSRRILACGVDPKTADKSVSEADEQGAQALMEDIVSEQSLSKKELAEKRKADRELLKEVLNEKGDEV